MVFMLPSEFREPQPEELAIAQLDLGSRPIIFEKPKEKSYKHLKGLYLKGLNDGRHWHCSQSDAVLSAAPIGSFRCWSYQDQCNAQ